MNHEFSALLDEFALDARERLAHVEQLVLDLAEEDPATAGPIMDRIRAELHTVKGNAGMMGFTELQGLAHSFEETFNDDNNTDVDVAAALKALDHIHRVFRDAVDGSDNGSMDEDATTVDLGHDHVGSIRVSFFALDQLLDLLAEVVILRNQLDQALHAERDSVREASQQQDAAWRDESLAFQGLSSVLDLLQGQVQALRLTPLGSLFRSLRRIVHDESERVGKTVRLETEGGDTPLDKSLLELANESLGHLVRNAVLHGIEDPLKREASGKPSVGTIRVRATTKGDEVTLVVSDDGGGIEESKLRDAARRKGIQFSPDHPYGLLFEHGFTTRETVDIGAGRGVGLSAVRDAVRRQGGEIDVSSTDGVGSEFTMRLPLSVSIARCLLLEADRELYAVPLSAVAQTRRLEAGDGAELNHAGVMRWRDSVISVLDIGDLFETRNGRRESGYVVVLEGAGRHRAVLVDHIRGLHEVVVKGLDRVVGAAPGIAGATVLGNGRPILVLDPRGLVTVEPFVRKAS